MGTYIDRRTGFAYEDESEQPSPDFDALFATVKRRHSWEVKQRDKKMFRTGSLSVCRDCGIERDQCLDFGHWRTRFRIAGAWVETKTPPCGQRD